MKRGTWIIGLLIAMLVWTTGVPANVFHMAPGLTSLETVPVGDAGNAGELSGTGAGGYGPDCICGAVNREFSIGKYEVTAGQYTEFLNKVAVTDTYGLYNTNMDTAVFSLGCNIKRTGSSGSYHYSVEADWANRPVNYVNFWDACRFANWLHNGQPTGAQGPGTTEDGAYTLTTDGMTNNTIVRNTDWQWAVTSEDEWYKAAYYKGGSTNAGYFDYPAGSDDAPGRDMSEATLPGNNANYYSEDFLIGSPYYRTPVGEFEESESPCGTYDQGGNLLEWNETALYNYVRGVRGGSFIGLGEPYSQQAAVRYFEVPTLDYYSIGFRVVQVPEPASMILLALGGVIGIRRRES